MKNLKILPKMFLQTFVLLSVIILLIHLSMFLIFPKTYLQSRKAEINSKADEIAEQMDGKDLLYIEEYLDVFSETGEIKGFIRGRGGDNEVKVKDNIDFDPKSKNNSIVIEERKINLNTGDEAYIQFVSTADMNREAKDLSLGILPYSLLISFFVSIIVSIIYARAIKRNIDEIKETTDKMMTLDKTAYLTVDSKNEVGELKSQINQLYSTLLESIDDLELKNKEILELERLKYNFFRGASHELKTPLASLKIILENMKFNIGKYKDRDAYITNCIEIVDGLTQNISQILHISSIEHMKNDEELIEIKQTLQDVLKKYGLLIDQKNIKINNFINDEKIFIGRSALKIVLSNLVGNAVKYTGFEGTVNIGIQHIHVDNLDNSDNVEANGDADIYVGNRDNKKASDNADNANANDDANIEIRHIKADNSDNSSNTENTEANDIENRDNANSHNANSNSDNRDNDNKEVSHECWLCIENTYDSDIEKIDVDNIFDINFNLNKENSSGLGLYIVKNLLENYNLMYKVENRDGMFVFKIKLEGDD